MQSLRIRRVPVRVQSTALFLFMAAVTWSPCRAFAQFTPIDYPGASNTQATAINFSREIVGRYLNADGSQHGFMLINGKFTSIDYPGAVFTDVTWVNDAGNIVGAYQLPSSNDYHGFLLSGGQFNPIDYAGLASTYVNGISRTGLIVGVGGDASNFIGFLLKNGKFSPVAFPGSGINSQEPTMVEEGPIVGGYNDDYGPHGYLLVGTCFKTINCPGTTGTYLSAIDEFGRMAGDEIFDDHQHGLLIYGGSCHAVDYPDSVSTYVNGINRLGDIVGRYLDTHGNTHGFIAENYVKDTKAISVECSDRLGTY
jgi:hypothetical protein